MILKNFIKQILDTNIIPIISPPPPIISPPPENKPPKKGLRNKISPALIIGILRYATETTISKKENTNATTRCCKELDELQPRGQKARTIHNRKEEKIRLGHRGLE